MIKDIVSNEKVKEFLSNELKLQKESGTYLFYGSDIELTLEFAISFSKGLCCGEIENDFCNECNICRRIENFSYSDLKIIDNPDGITIDEIRELTEEVSKTSFEGRKKIFLIKDIGKMKKHSANALLKLIEEPNKNTYFMLLNKDLNILPTIKSRCILVKIRLRTAEELGVDDFVYEFFRSDAKDIEEYKKTEIDIKQGYSYLDIKNAILDYLELQDIESKIKIYKAIRDFIRNKDYIKDIDKIYFAEEIIDATSDKNILSEIIAYTVDVLKDRDKLEERLIKKQIFKTPINIKLFLIDFFLNL